MIYFRKIEKMIYTFCPKTSINNDRKYKPLFFDSTPQNDIGGWVKNLQSKNKKEASHNVLFENEKIKKSED